MPIELNIEQGTREWLEARLGIPTASQAGRVVTPPIYRESDEVVHARLTQELNVGRLKRAEHQTLCATGTPLWCAEMHERVTCQKCRDTIDRYGLLSNAYVPDKKIREPGGCQLSESRSTYLGELLAEWYSGEPFQDFESDWMARGSQLEAAAFDYFAFITDMEPRKVGLVYKDERRMVAASPDALVGDDDGLEIKCPRTDTHLVYLAGGVLPQKYTAQVQTCMWVSGRKSWHFMSYHPGLPELLVKVERDEKYQAALDKHMPEFIGEIITARDLLTAAGVKRWADQ